MYSSRENPYPPLGRSLEIPRERWVLKLKSQNFRSIEAKLEFPWAMDGWGGGGGAKQRNLPLGSIDIFLELHNLHTGSMLLIRELVITILFKEDSPCLG